MINGVIAGLDGCDAYIDDVVAFSNSWEKHITQLNLMKEARLMVNLVKSEFCQARVVILGHVVGQGKVQPVMAKAFFDFPAPINKNELMRFLGMSEYYWKFCHNFSVVAEPLTRLLKKVEPFRWSGECQRSFNKIKSLLSSVSVLAVPNFDLPFKAHGRCQ